MECFRLNGEITVREPHSLPEILEALKTTLKSSGLEVSPGGSWIVASRGEPPGDRVMVLVTVPLEVIVSSPADWNIKFRVESPNPDVVRHVVVMLGNAVSRIPGAALTISP